jgi:3-oxosteroid 1-dehydrogenase
MSKSNPQPHASEGPDQGRRQLLQSAASTGAMLATSAGLSAFSASAQAAEETFDVVVIGSGAAGMTAALTAAKRGLKAVVIEKAPTFGGSTARSGAGIWIRNNEVLLKAGVPDTPEKAATYLKAVVGTGSTDDRQAAFLNQGPTMISFILQNTPLRFRWMEGYSDYYPELPGGMPNGASIEPDLFDGKLLGAELANLNKPYLATPPGLAVFGGEYKWINLAAVSANGLQVASQCISRYSAAKRRGEIPLTMGQALAAGLRAGLLNANVPVRLNTPLVDLIFDDTGRATGVLINQNGTPTTLKARLGVVVASGGFEHNLSMRQAYQQQPIGTQWTVGAKENTGDGILAGQRAGAALDLMDDAWWGPSVPLPTGPYFCLAERSLPGSILINAEGQRYGNEALPYVDAVHTMYQHNVRGGAMPTWLIFDQRYRNRYVLRDLLPLQALPKAWYDSGAVVRDTTLDGLGAKIGLPAGALKATVARFNGFAKAGQDLDFHRGESAYDRYYTDPAIKPNPALAPLTLAPYYALKIVPGDLGTKGGLKTDARARVLRPDGSVIPGLYAAGNASAAVMGHSYAGAGATIGPAMTFAYIAGQDMADNA